MKQKRPIVAIDFDGVLNNYGQLMPLARDSMARIADLGFYIVIHTLRAKTDYGASFVAEYLDYYDVPYHEITATKPDALIFIDDRAVQFIAWPQALQEVEKLAIIE